MKIIIEDGVYSYSVDYSKNDKIEGGWLEEYFPPVEEPIDMFFNLLSNVYSREKIAKYLASGNLPAMDYYKPENEEEDEEDK